MDALQPKLTSIGMRAIFNATNTGLNAAITHIAFGDGNDAGYLPSGNETELVNEIVRVPVGGGLLVTDSQIQVQALLDDSASFWMHEVGFILEDGTLLAVWSDPDTPLAYKSDGVPLAVAYDLAFEGLPPNSVTIVTSGPQVNIVQTENWVINASAIARNASDIISIMHRQVVDAIQTSERINNVT